MFLYGTSSEIRCYRVTFQPPGVQGIAPHEADSLDKNTINQRKINGTWEATAESARSHETLELITGENELREVL